MLHKKCSQGIAKSPCASQNPLAPTHAPFCRLVHIRPPPRRQCIHFIKKQHTRRRRTCPAEQLPNRPLTLPHVFVQQLGSLDGDEIGPTLISYSLGNEGFPTSRGSKKQDTMTQWYVEGGVVFWVGDGLGDGKSKLLTNLGGGWRGGAGVGW